MRYLPNGLGCDIKHTCILIVCFMVLTGDLKLIKNRLVLLLDRRLPGFNLRFLALESAVPFVELLVLFVNYSESVDKLVERFFEDLGS